MRGGFQQGTLLLFPWANSPRFFCVFFLSPTQKQQAQTKNMTQRRGDTTEPAENSPPGDREGSPQAALNAMDINATAQSGSAGASGSNASGPGASASEAGGGGGGGRGGLWWTGGGSSPRLPPPPGALGRPSPTLSVPLRTEPEFSGRCYQYQYCECCRETESLRV